MNVDEEKGEVRYLRTVFFYLFLGVKEGIVKLVGLFLIPYVALSQILSLILTRKKEREKK